MELGKLLTKDIVNDLIFRKGYSNFRISQLGRCHRGVQYNVVGVKPDEPPEKTKKMWAERLEDEGRIVKKLKKKFKVKHSTPDQWTHYRKIIKPESIGDVIVSATPDGLIKFEDEWIPLEIKSLNPFKFDNIKGPQDLSREYFIQTQGEMLLTNSKKLFYAIGNSKTKEDVKSFQIDFDETVLSWIERRIKYIMSFQDKGWWIYPEFLPESDKCRWCMYKTKCKKDVYKGFKISYNRSEKIEKDDFDFEALRRLDKYFSASKSDLEDAKLNLLKTAHEMKVMLLTRKAKELTSKKFSISLDEINKVIEELK